MPNFLENIFAQLKRSADRVVLREIRGEQFFSVTGAELLDRVQRVRASLRRYALQPGDRCALLAPNSIRWLAIDLAYTAIVGHGGVPNLVAGNTGTKTDVFQIRLSGPPARKHLASEYKIPGPSGGIAP